MKAKKIYISLFLSILSMGMVYGQYNQAYRQYFLHQQIINPATSGSEYFPVINTTYSRQWLGITNSPNTQLISGSFRIGNFDFYNPKMYVNQTNLEAYERIGAGFVFFSDNEGPVSNRGGQLSYSYHVPLSNAVLALGLSTGLYQSLVDESGFSPINSLDPIIHYGRESFLRFNSAFGAYYYSTKIFAGLSVTDILPLENPDFQNTRIKQDLHLIGGYLFNPTQKTKFEPSLYIGFLDYSNLNFQINAKIYYEHVNWISFHYRSTGELGFLAGIKVNRIHIAYGYDASLSKIFRYNIGTHQIHLGTNLGIRRLEGF